MLLFNMLFIFSNLKGPVCVCVCVYVLFVPQPSTERLEMLTVPRMGMQGPHYQDSSINMH
jgi:hypothetical protein